jgi:hypothetical protein
MEEWGLGERGARRTTHLIEATNVAHGDARMRVKHMKTQRSGGLGVGGEAQVCCVCLLSSSGEDPEIIHVCLPRLALALSRPRAIRAKSMKSCAGGTFVRRTNDFNTFGEGQLLG